MAGLYLGGRKGPKEKRTLKGTANERAALMSLIADLPEVRPAERMSPDVAEQAFSFISCGGSLKEFCRRARLPFSTVATWIHKNAPDAYAKAKEAGCEALSEYVQHIVTTEAPSTERIVTTDAEGRVTVTEKTADNVQARKLAAWGCLELMKSWSPDRYGKRVTVEAGGRMAEAIAAARGRVGETEGRRLTARPASADEVIDVTPEEPSGDLF